MPEQYDIAIIGSGLGGLSCGVILAKEELNVCIVEQHSVVGGCLQSFSRGGALFDTGIHYIGSMGNGQIMRQFLRYYGVDDKIKTMPVSPDAYETICIGTEQYKLPICADAFVEAMSSRFPAESEGIRALVSEIMEVKNSISLQLLTQGKISDVAAQRYMSVSAYDTICEHIHNATLRDIFGSSSLLFGGEKETATFYQYAMVMGSNIEGAYRILGGTQTLANAMARQIEKHGGKVLTGEKATQIITNGQNSIDHVRTSENRQIRAKYYISAVHPNQTFTMLDSVAMLKRPFVARMQQLRNTYGMFSVYATLRKEAIPFQNTFYLIHNHQSPWFSSDIMAGKAGEASLMFSLRPSDNGEWADTASIITPISFADVEKWNDTHVGHRGADYETWKGYVAQLMIKRAESVCPNLSSAVTGVYTSSPLTFRDYTLTPQGSAYGVMKNCQNPLSTIIPTQTKLRNLLLTGQSIYVPGAIGVTMTAALTCANILGEEYLAKKIAQA